ncbi:MAG: ATP-binding protein [Candidatus Kapaibacterium sp.]
MQSRNKILVINADKDIELQLNRAVRDLGGGIELIYIKDRIRATEMIADESVFCVICACDSTIGNYKDMLSAARSSPFDPMFVLISRKIAWQDIPDIVRNGVDEIAEKDDTNAIKEILRKVAAKLITEGNMRPRLDYNDLYRNFFLLSPVPSALISRENGRIIDVNPAFADLFCVSRESFIGASAAEQPCFYDYKEGKNIVSENFVPNNYFKKEVWLQNAEGDRIILLVTMNEDKVAGRQVIFFKGLDITDRKALDEELELALDKQRELNLLKSKFLSMISHEFRSPLTTIMLSTDMIKQYGNMWDDAEREKHFGRIRNTVLRMTQLMENVMIIGRMETGMMEANPEYIDLEDYCKALADNIEFSHGSQGQLINIACTGNCHDIYIDENLLGLIINNLLSNAIKYSPTGTNVDFRVNCSKKGIEFRISDRGIGIPKEDIPHLFSSFFRAKNTKNINGYGLGLAIVKNCVDSLRGDIRVESKINRGTTFIVNIPPLD